MNDLISRQTAYEVLTEYYHHRTFIQHEALKDALNRVPTTDVEIKDYILKVIDDGIQTDINRRVIEFRKHLENRKDEIMRDLNFRIRVNCELDEETIEKIITVYCDKKLKVPEPFLEARI